MNPAATPQPFPETDLRARIAGLETDLRRQTARADGAVKDLQAFTYSVSHDLRAPLRAIAGFTRVLIEEHAAKVDDDARRALQRIREESNRMSQLIEGLLIFSRVGNQRLDPSEIDVTALAQGVIQDFVEARPTLTIPFEVHPLPFACGDRGMIRQVLANLLDNAVKFSARQPAPKIVVTGGSADGWSTYCVADNGVGFEPRYAHKLFGVFQRLHNQDDFEGAGVGLAVVQRIVQRHGGNTWGDGRPGGGAKFYFTLPEGSGHHS